MRLAVATTGGHPSQIRVWSGIPSYVVAELRTRPVELELIGPVARSTYVAGRALSSVTRRVGHKVNWELEPKVLSHLTRRLAARLAASPPVDAVLALGWTPYPAELLGVPVIYWGDATYAQRLDRAPHWSNLSVRTRRHLGWLEAEIFRRFHAIVMPSRWAADDLVARHGVAPERVHVIPFGANLAPCAPVMRAAPRDQLHLLLVGVEWERKGVDVAVLATDELRARGWAATLDVVGVLPPSPAWYRPYVRYHGFLDKRQPETAATLERLYREAHLFVLPTRNDPSPVVLGEAASRGLPAVATAVGGVPERVEDGVSGLLLAPDLDPPAWANGIERLVADPERYQRLVAGATLRAAVAANWSKSVDQLLAILPGGGSKPA